MKSTIEEKNLNLTIEKINKNDKKFSISFLKRYLLLISPIVIIQTLYDLVFCEFNIGKILINLICIFYYIIIMKFLYQFIDDIESKYIVKYNNCYDYLNNKWKLSVDELDKEREKSQEIEKNLNLTIEKNNKIIDKLKSTIEEIESTTISNLNISLYETEVERDKLYRELESLHHELDDNINNSNINLDNIYELYQIYLLIRKYNILNYKISVNPVHADIYCKMVTYTKISIQKELLSTVSFHIDGTNVILKGEIKNE